MLIIPNDNVIINLYFIKGDFMRNTLKEIVGNNEKILWSGKPSKKCFILESIFNKMLPFALIWTLFDSIFIGAAIMSGEMAAIAFICIFMLIHMMPVWAYLGGVIASFKKYKNTEYVITDKGIYISGETWGFNYEMKPFTDLSHVKIRRGIFDQWLNVGDVISLCNHNSSISAHDGIEVGMTIHDIPDYMEVFNLIKQLQTDIYSDTMYPNDMRPKTNSGYQTEYTGPIRKQ